MKLIRIQWRSLNLLLKTLYLWHRFNTSWQHELIYLKYAILFPDSKSWMWLIQSGFIQAENILALKLQCCCYNQLLLVSVDKNKCFEKAVSTGCDPADTDPRFCWTGSAVRGEWGSAHIRANLPRSPGHAHEDRDDVARRVQPDKQAEPRAHWAGVGGARSTKCWEERTTRQWHQVSHGTPRPQESAGSRIIWLESTLVCRVFHILKIFVYRSLPRFPPLIVITALFISPPSSLQSVGRLWWKFGSLCSVF